MNTTASLPATETWSWAQRFTIDIPSRWGVVLLDEAAELRPFDGDLIGHVTLLERQPGGGRPGDGLAPLIERFARARGAAGGLAVDLYGTADLDAGGIHRARAMFEGDGGAWLVVVTAWDADVVLCTAFDPHTDAPAFAEAEAIFESVRPLERVLPVAFEPDAPGDF